MDNLPHLKITLRNLIITIILIAGAGCNQTYKLDGEFDGERAYADVEYQVSLGARVPGSFAHTQIREWISGQVKNSGWLVEIQTVNINGLDIFNIVAKKEKKEDLPWVIIGAHYDTRKVADKDPVFSNRVQPVPGANDGASGVSILLELSRSLPAEIGANIWLVFFDAEDNGNLPGGEWILGSRTFVESLEGRPEAVIILDMVGDEDLNIFYEKNSDQNLSREIWKTAEDLGFGDKFIDFPKHRVIDDHLPFVQAGIPAVDIIDLDYPFWHTTGDTLDKVSAESLDIVGQVVLTWLRTNYGSD